MGLINAELGKKKKPFKTIIIPKGTINPNENNVIEIPIHFDTNSSLIVKANSDGRSTFCVEPYLSGAVANNPAFNENPRFINEGVAMGNPVPPNPYPVPNQAAAAAAAVPNNWNYAAVNQPNPYMFPDGRMDFGVQTPDAHPCLIQLPPGYQPRQDPHSPLCPVCFQPSCKGPVQRNYPCPLGLACSKIRINCNNMNDPLIYRPLPCIKSEILLRANKLQELNNNYGLNKIINEKIDKILRPILLSLGKSFPDDDEREICQRVINPLPKCSSGYLCQKYSRDCFYPQRSPSPIYCDPRRRYVPDYDRRRYNPDYNQRRYNPDYDQKRYNPDYDQKQYNPNYRQRPYNPDYDFPEKQRYKKNDFPKYGKFGKIEILGGNLVDMRPPRERDRFYDNDLRARKFWDSSPKYKPMCPTGVACKKRSNDDAPSNPWGTQIFPRISPIRAEKMPPKKNPDLNEARIIDPDDPDLGSSDEDI